jgi:two-component system chemotaxis response regulator CheY
MPNTTSRVLVVDDSPTLRRMVQAALRPIGGLVFTEAGNGLEAIERLASATPALVILDLNMPDMHGLEVLKFLRGHSSFADLPVVVLTTRGDDSSRAAAMAAGATRYLTKPFTPDALCSAVAEVLNVDGRGPADREEPRS